MYIRIPEAPLQFTYFTATLYGFFYCSVSSTLSAFLFPPTPLIYALKIDKKYKCHVDFVIRLRCAIEIPELSFRSPQIYPSASHITSSVHVR